MSFSRTLTFLFAAFLIFFAFPQDAVAQDDPHKTEHLKAWSAIDFADDPNIEIVEEKGNHCLVAEVTNVPGRRRYLLYLNAEFETGSAEITPRMKTVARKCESVIRDYFNGAHAIVVYGTDNAELNNQSAQRPLSEIRSPEKQQSNDFRIGQLRANAGRNLFVGVLADVKPENASIYTPPKVELSTVSAPDSLQALEDLSDRNSLEFRKSFFGTMEVYEYGALSDQKFQNRIAAMNRSVNRRFRAVDTRIDSLGKQHDETREMARMAIEAAKAAQDSAAAAQATAQNAESLAQKALEWTQGNTRVMIGSGGEYFAGESSLMAELGIRIENTGIGDIELSSFRGINLNIGSINLPKLGERQLGRSTKGGKLAWYPIQHKRLEIGPAFGYAHGEDFIRDREESEVIYEALQVGLGANVKIWKGLHLHGELLYSETISAEAANRELRPISNQPFRASVTVRWRF